MPRFEAAFTFVLLSTCVKLAAAAPWGDCAFWTTNSTSAADVEPPLALIPAFAAPAPLGTVPAPRNPITTVVSERATTPTQAVPDDATIQVRSGCPHLRVGLRAWHDPTIWPSGVVPEGGNVTLPLNTSVLLGSCSLDPASRFDTITIPAGSALVFADAPNQLHARSVLVYGSLLAGAPTCRLRSAINITLYGSRSEVAPEGDVARRIDVLPGGTKAIMGFNGARIEMHGVQYAPTWSRLASPALRGDLWIYLMDTRVNWEPGQTVMVATTALKDARDYSESEERVIAAIYALPEYGNITAVQLSQPLNFSHYAGGEYQAEVALLSRRLVVQGAEDDSVPTDPQPRNLRCRDGAFSSVPCSHNHSLTGYGGQVMVMGNLSVGRFAGIGLYRMGKTNVMGHYPVHFHFLGDSGASSYVTDSAIWRSFYRCVSTHATNAMTLQGNVAHDVTGFCFYLEDGVEERNQYLFNLASLVHPIGTIPRTGMNSGQSMYDQPATPYLLIPADTGASGFYITNPYNVFRGNAAIGGWAGYSFPQVETALGNSRYISTLRPHTRPTLAFDGNTGHSSGWWWDQSGVIYVGGRLWYKNASDTTLTYNSGRVNPSRPAQMVANNTKLFLTSGVGLMHWGSVFTVERLEVHDFGRAATVFGNVGMFNLLFNCRSRHAPASPGSGWAETDYYKGGLSVFQFYDVGQNHVLRNVTFRNCSRISPAIRLWEMLTHSDEFVPEAMQATSGVSYEGGGSDRYRIGVTANGSAVGPSVSLRLQNWIDADGSASGRGVPTLMGSSRSQRWWMLDEGCGLRADWGVWMCDLLPGRYPASLYLTYMRNQSGGLGDDFCSNGQPMTVPCPDVGRVRHVGRDTWDDGMPFSRNSKITGPAGGFGWYVTFAAGAPVSLNISGVQLRQVDNLTLVLPYPPGASVEVTARLTGSCPSTCTAARGCACVWNFTSVNSPEAVRAGAGDGYHLSPDGHLYLRVTPQTSAGFGSAGKWVLPAVRGFTSGGIEIPPRTSGYLLSIRATCPNGTYDAGGVWCATPTAMPAPPSPCTGGWGQSAYDRCASATPSSSGTASSTGSSTATASGTGSGSFSATTTATATGTGSRTVSTTGTPSFGSSPTRTPLATTSATGTQTRTPTGTASRTAASTGTATSTRTPSVTPSGTATRTAPLTSTGTASGTASATGTPPLPVTPSGTGSFSGTATSTATATVTGTGSLSGTATWTATATATGTVRGTVTPTVTATGTVSGTVTGSQTASLSATTSAILTAPVSGTLTGTTSVTGTRTGTASATRTQSSTASTTRTKTGTPASTKTSTVTGTPASTKTSTGTGTPASTETSTGTGTPASTETSTGTGTPASTGTSTATGTPASTETSTATGTPASTETATATCTPSGTGTGTSSLTVTRTGTSTSTTTGTTTSSLSMTGTGTPSSTATGTGSVSATATGTGTPTGSLTGTATASLTGSGSRSATASVSGSGTASKTAAPTATRTETRSRTPGPTFSVTRSGSSAASPTRTRAPALARSPSPSLTRTASRSRSMSRKRKR